MSRYQVSAEAQNDLFEIWQRIAEDSVDLATFRRKNAKSGAKDHLLTRVAR